MREEVVETREMTSYRTTNCEERIEHKLNMLFDEMLDLRQQFEYIKNEYFKDKLTQEKKKLEYELEDKTRIIQNIENSSSYNYEIKQEKRDRFNCIK